MSDTPTSKPATGRKMRRPNRLRGPGAAAAKPARRATFVPKLLSEVLPEAVRNALPEEARDLFLQGYNYALEEYGDHERALHLGWAAVGRHYHKVGTQWLPKPAEPHLQESTLPHANPDVVERLRQLHDR
jgi:cation transport regulator ChaB